MPRSTRDTDEQDAVNNAKFSAVWDHVATMNREMGELVSELKFIRQDNQTQHDAINTHLAKQDGDYKMLRERVRWIGYGICLVFGTIILSRLSLLK